MNRRKIIASLLSLVLVLSTILPGTIVYAVEETSGNTSGMEISKNATANDDGTYTITLEAYATGSKVITETMTDIPTDIVLVLDQSGSMDDDIGTVSFSAYGSSSSSNENHYNRRHNGGSSNLYYPLGNGAYASVSVERKQSITYTALGELVNYDTSWGQLTDECYFYYSENLYAKVNGIYQKVTVSRNGSYWDGYSYDYTLEDGTVIGTSSGNDSIPSFSLVDGGILYSASVDESASVYTYTYTDANGEIQNIGSSTGASTRFATTLYQKTVSTSGGGSRLAALKNAVTTFANNVAAKAGGDDGEIGTDDDINHTISVVGFANYSNYDNYNNTEVFIGSTGYKYGTNAQAQYANVPQDMSTKMGIDNITASIGALDANGATYIDLGIEMANGILNANPVPAGETRNRVVVIFTDGVPGYSGSYGGDSYGSQGENAQAVADAAMTQIDVTKNTHKATVYTVGIFAGADASSAGKSDGTDTERANYFMQQLSSNNGTPRTPSYYLSASDNDTLNNIFQQISDQIESGGSSTTLGSSTVIKDIIAPAFELPEEADASSIMLETYSCTGIDSSGNYTWSKNEDAMGATATVDGDQVDVTGFDFSENYVGTVTNSSGTTYRGHKLVISFTVTPKAGFLGGNNVYTNTSAGVYENDSAENPVMEFERPHVNVPIKDITVTAQDKNIYLLGDLTANQLQTGTIVKVGDVTFNMEETVENYGLESWQNEYVNIAYKDANGNAVTGLTDLTTDQTYTISVTVDPKDDGEGADGAVAVKKTGSGNANINVFKPQLTFKDSDVWYGDNAPESYEGNLVSTKWFHETTEAVPTTMIGEAPTIDKTYTPDASKISVGKINSKQDISVDVAIKIGTTDIADYTTFLHENCSGKTCTLPTGTEFLLHVNTCQLTIKKNGGATGEPYVITVKKDDSKYTELTLNSSGEATIYELPVGTYSIVEDNNWSWRYNASYSGSVELSNTNTSGTITCTNTKKTDKETWLNGFSTVVKNIFGEAKTYN